MSEHLPFDPDNALLLVADDWPSLRRCDVFRLFDACAEEHWPALVDRIRGQRPALYPGALHEIEAIICERSPEYVKDQPLDPPGYARRVAVLEYANGLTRGDAQGVADLEFAGVIAKQLQ